MVALGPGRGAHSCWDSFPTGLVPGVRSGDITDRGRPNGTACFHLETRKQSCVRGWNQSGLFSFKRDYALKFNFPWTQGTVAAVL